MRQFETRVQLKVRELALAQVGDCYQIYA
jgi:hypothetical protein